jgi:hypothetical protein
MTSASQLERIIGGIPESRRRPLAAEDPVSRHIREHEEEIARSEALPISDSRVNGLQFKPLQNCGQTWSLRIGRNHQAALRRDGDAWQLLRVLPRGRIYDAVCG